MIRLVAYSQDDTTAVDLDLFEDEKIALTLNVDDIRTVSDKIGSYSKDFDLPATISFLRLLIFLRYKVNITLIEVQGLNYTKTAL